MIVKTKSIVIATSLAFLVVAQSVSALSSYVSRIPNGSSQSCANCHVDGVPPDLNPFGNAFSATHAWSASLAAADSDGDGFSNGQELGDPTGAWKPGAALPIPGAQVTLPGDSTSTPTLTPPPISMSSPASGTTAPAPFTGPLTATTTAAAASISKVAFYNGSTLLGTVTSAPYSLAVNLGAGTYTITAKATDYLGAVGTSAAVQLTVNAAATAPTIATQPASQTANAGANVSFSVTASGTAPLSYQWQKDGTAIAGATSATLALSAVATASAGSYTVTVSNSAGSVTSAAATLTVNVPATAPTIATPPASQTVNAGANVSFSVTASGTAPLSYQWKKDGTAITGATSATLALSAITTASAGSYTVTVSNSAGSVTSAAATLTVNVPATAPTIATQPASQTVNAGANVSFSVTATGTAPLSYQWKKNGTAVAGATSATLALTSVTTASAGSYTVTVSNAAGSVTSAAATLTVNVPATAPAITSQPASQTVTAGASVTFSVVATGTAPLTYQWQRNGVNVAGATSASLALSNVTSNNAGIYVVIVSNSVGSVASTAATLTINPAAVAPAIATQPASQSVAAGANVSMTVVATGTAPLSYQWKKNGVNIAGATSATLTLSSVATTAAGSYTVVVSNAAGSVTSAPAVLTVSAASTLSISLTSPTNGAAIDASGDVTLTAEVTGDTNVVSVEFLDGTNVLGIATAAPYSLTVSNLDAGQHVLTATVTTTTATATSEPVTITVAGSTSEGPVVAMVLPRDGVRYYSSQQILLGAKASSANARIVSVEFYAGTVRLGTGVAIQSRESDGEDDAPAATMYALIWTHVPVGNYLVTAKATDSLGMTATSAPTHVSVIQAPRRTTRHD